MQILKKNKNVLIFLGILLFLLGWSILLYYVPPTEIVDFVGAKNSYWVMFLIAGVAGVSGLTSASYYASFITFVVGGSDPILLSIISGIGMTSGDIAFYFLGKKGVDALSQNMRNHVLRFESWLKKIPQKFVPLFIYCYTSFTLFPGDILSVLLGVGDYSFKKMLLPFMLGNITFLLVISILTLKGFDLSLAL